MSDLAAKLDAIDAIATAERMLSARNPQHAAIAMSNLEILAIGRRLLALQRTAAMAYALMVCFDELELVIDREPERASALGDDAVALTRSLAAALTALGFCPSETADRRDNNAS